MSNVVDEYIEPFSEPVRSKLIQLREHIRKQIPEATEKISYGMPTYVLNGNLVHFGGFKNHIGFYPAPSGIEKFKHRFESYKWSKGCVQFPLDQPLPLHLITEIIAFRIEENRNRKK